MKREFLKELEMMAEVDEDHLNLFRYFINEAKNSSIKDS